MRALVTGGAGFIGAHLIKALSDKGIEVAAFDNLSTGKAANVSREIKFYKGDLLERNLVIECVLAECPEIVIHLAAQVSVPGSLKAPAADAMVNIAGTLNLLEASRLGGVRKVIYASTAAVYGNPVHLPIDERHPVQPLSGYGLSKHTAERYLALYRELYGLDYTVLRYANVYGPGQDAAGEGGVVAVFGDRLKRGERPVIYGDGEQTRDFIHVSDIVEANLCALQKGSGATLNIGAGKPVSINSLFKILKKEAGYGGDPSYGSPRPGDIRNSWFDISRAASVLGWAPRKDLEQGIKDFLINKF